MTHMAKYCVTLPYEELWGQDKHLVTQTRPITAEELRYHAAAAECGRIVCAVTSMVTDIHSDNKVQHYSQESETALQVVLPQPSSLATKQLSVENRHLHGSQAWCGEFAR